MRAILQGWNFMRLLRLALGSAVLMQGIISKEPMTVVLGAMFGGMALANIGCCGTNGCAFTPGSTNKAKKMTNEELDIKE